MCEPPNWRTAARGNWSLRQGTIKTDRIHWDAKYLVNAREYVSASFPWDCDCISSTVAILLLFRLIPWAIQICSPMHTLLPLRNGVANGLLGIQMVQGIVESLKRPRHSTKHSWCMLGFLCGHRFCHQDTGIFSLQVHLAFISKKERGFKGMYSTVVSHLFALFLRVHTIARSISLMSRSLGTEWVSTVTTRLERHELWPPWFRLTFTPPDCSEVSVPPDLQVALFMSLHLPYFVQYNIKTLFWTNFWNKQQHGLYAID
jgi:hypothetical protein